MGFFSPLSIFFFLASRFGEVGVGARARWHKSRRRVALKKKKKKNPALGQGHIAFIAVICERGEKFGPPSLSEPPLNYVEREKGGRAGAQIETYRRQ